MESRLPLKIFALTFFITFTMVSLNLFGIKMPNITSPLAKTEDVFESVVRPKLTKYTNTYTVSKPTTFVRKANAGSELDNASAYIVVDYDTGEIIREKNVSRQLPIASITKIMTAIVALDLAEENEDIVITKKAARQIPTKIGVIPGQKMTVSELLHAVMLTSANDATEAVKDGINEKYQKEIFIYAMNEKAKHIGLKNTSYANPQGFDDPLNYSSVEDLAILTHYAYTNYPLFAEIAQKDYTQLAKNEMHKQYDLYNWNGLIGVYPGAFGVKIGNTGDAGKTTVVAAEREGKKMIAVVLGAPGIRERDMWSAELLDLGFEQKYNMKPVKITNKALQLKYDSWEYWK